MARNLTKKQKGFVKDYAETGIGSLAVKRNYDVLDDGVARVIASQNLTKPPIVKALQEYFTDELLKEKHFELLSASRLDHMVFGLGPKNEKEKEEYIARAVQKSVEEGKEYEPTEYLTDEDIREMLEDVNCKVRRIVHRETARDVYFWSADNMARDKALDKAYKIKGTYAPEKSVSVNIEVESDSVIKDLAHQLNEIHRGTGFPSDGRDAITMGTEVQDKDGDGSTI